MMTMLGCLALTTCIGRYRWTCVACVHLRVLQYMLDQDGSCPKHWYGAGSLATLTSLDLLTLSELAC